MLLSLTRLDYQTSVSTLIGTTATLESPLKASPCPKRVLDAYEDPKERLTTLPRLGKQREHEQDLFVLSSSSWGGVANVMSVSIAIVRQLKDGFADKSQDALTIGFTV